MKSVNISFNISKSNLVSHEYLKLAARSNNGEILHFCDGAYIFCFDSINSAKQDVGIMAKG